MPGWQEDTSQCRTYQDLPLNARNYVEKIDELVNVSGTVIDNVGYEDIVTNCHEQKLDYYCIFYNVLSILDQKLV